MKITENLILRMIEDQTGITVKNNNLHDGDVDYVIRTDLISKNVYFESFNPYGEDFTINYSDYNDLKSEIENIRL